MAPVELPKVYLCCSIRAGRCSKVPYSKLVQLIAKHAMVLNPCVTADPDSSACEEKNMSDNEIHDKAMQLVRDCDVIVAEVTQPSFGVGYEVGSAVELKKPVLCIHIPDAKTKVSAMIGWAATEPNTAHVQLRSYDDEQQLEVLLEQYFGNVPGRPSMARKASIDWKSYEPM